MLGRKKKNHLIKELETSNGLLTDERQIANEPNDYFSEIGNTMASKLESAIGESINQLNTLFYNFTSIEYNLATTTEVLKIIRGLKAGKAPGYDDIYHYNVC